MFTLTPITIIAAAVIFVVCIACLVINIKKELE
jgi:hypothetical protein